MTGAITPTIVGNLTAAPELRWTQNGLAVANFTVAVSERTFDRQANEWKEGATSFVRCSAWRDLAEHVSGSLDKGSRVIVTGQFREKAYTDRDNQQRKSWELEVDEIGPSLRFATAQVTRSQGQGGRGGANSAPAGNQPDPAWNAAQPGTQQQDAWSAPAGDYNDETPF